MDSVLYFALLYSRFLCIAWLFLLSYFHSFIAGWQTNCIWWMFCIHACMILAISFRNMTASDVGFIWRQFVLFIALLLIPATIFSGHPREAFAGGWASEGIKSNWADVLIGCVNSRGSPPKRRKQELYPGLDPLTLLGKLDMVQKQNARDHRFAVHTLELYWVGLQIQGTNFHGARWVFQCSPEEIAEIKQQIQKTQDATREKAPDIRVISFWVHSYLNMFLYMFFLTCKNKLCHGMLRWLCHGKYSG